MSKLNPIYPKEFLCCLSLQAGVVGSSVVGLTVAVITILVNIYETNGEHWSVQAIQYTIFGFYQAMMCAAFVLIYLASFWEDSGLLRVAAYIIIGLLCMYIVMAVVSIIPSYSVMVYVCPGMRCPDLHWLHVDRWRRVVMVEELHPNISTTASPDQEPRNVFARRLWPHWASPEWQNIYENSKINEKSNNKTFRTTKERLLTPQDTDNDVKLNYFNSDLEGEGPVDTNKIQTTEESTVKKYRDIKRPNQMLFIIISVLYVILYIVYLTYTVLALLSFAAELDS